MFFYVLNVKKILLSVAIIVNMGHLVMFGKHTCWIVVAIELHKRLVVSNRNSVNSLYKLKIMMPPKHEQHVSLFLLIKRQSTIELLASKDYTNFLG